MPPPLCYDDGMAERKLEAIPLGGLAVAASTQNQALAAVLFLYEHVLGNH